MKIILVDMFEALNFFKEQSIIHCDLKPENIMFINKTTYNVVIGDYGLARSCYIDKLDYFKIQTRWYKAPEVVFNIPYSYPIDMWSIGAIMIELLIDVPVFLCNDDYELFLMMEYFIENAYRYMIDNVGVVYHRRIKDFINHHHDPNKHFRFKKHITKVKYSIEKHAITEINYLIKKIFVWNPDKRITPIEALNYLLDNNRRYSL